MPLADPRSRSSRIYVPETTEMHLSIYLPTTATAISSFPRTAVDVLSSTTRGVFNDVLSLVSRNGRSRVSPGRPPRSLRHGAAMAAVAAAIRHVGDGGGPRAGAVARSPPVGGGGDAARRDGGRAGWPGS